MSLINWKEVLLKERTLCNQKVLLVKKESESFSIDEFQKNLPLFFEKTNFKNESEVIEGFELLIELVKKNYLKQLQGTENLFFDCSNKIRSLFPDSQNNSFFNFANVLHKISLSSKEFFLNRLLLLLETVTSEEEFKSVLIILYWASGKPESRESAYSLFVTLSNETKAAFKTKLNISEDFLSAPFPVGQSIKDSIIHFRLVPGYTLFGGQFFTLPILLGNPKEIYIKDENQTYSIVSDRLGTSILSSEIDKNFEVNKNLSPVWATILEKRINLEEITSTIYDESFVFVTMKNSYNLYLFYLGNPK